MTDPKTLGDVPTELLTLHRSLASTLEEFEVERTLENARKRFEFLLVTVGKQGMPLSFVREDQRMIEAWEELRSAILKSVERHDSALEESATVIEYFISQTSDKEDAEAALSVLAKIKKELR